MQREIENERERTLAVERFSMHGEFHLDTVKKNLHHKYIPANYVGGKRMKLCWWDTLPITGLCEDLGLDFCSKELVGWMAGFFLKPMGPLGTCAECRGVQSDGVVLIISSNRGLDAKTFHPETVATNTFLLICFHVGGKWMTLSWGGILHRIIWRFRCSILLEGGWLVGFCII